MATGEHLIIHQGEVQAMGQATVALEAAVITAPQEEATAVDQVAQEATEATVEREEVIVLQVEAMAGAIQALLEEATEPLAAQVMEPLEEEIVAEVIAALARTTVAQAREGTAAREEAMEARAEATVGQEEAIQVLVGAMGHRQVDMGEAAQAAGGMVAAPLAVDTAVV